MNFYRVCVLSMLCFCIGQRNIYLYPLDQWGLPKSRGSGQGVAPNECLVFEVHTTIL